ncbi:acyl carrier protein [Streptomyces sp. MS1.HAVA.3]|uniref:Acyl carrier protein n=1 Tax=Streptomyces caledonius TaxID=3134107 RepID=A0ABU8U278_9ACTN
MPLKVNLRALRARTDDIPPVLRALAGAPGRATGRTAAAAPAGAPDRFAERLGRVPEEEREAFLTDVVRDHVAAVLGHASKHTVEPGRAFQEMGFDSLAAVELRNQLGAATGVRLPATVVFDHPTPLALSRHLRAQIDPAQADPYDRCSPRSSGSKRPSRPSGRGRGPRQGLGPAGGAGAQVAGPARLHTGNRARGRRPRRRDG